MGEDDFLDVVGVGNLTGVRDVACDGLDVVGKFWRDARRDECRSHDGCWVFS